jgi:hypothetical protein
LGTGWRCIHRDAWEDKHNVFFAENNFFCQSTIFTLGAQKSRQSRAFQASASNDFWIIDTEATSPSLGRAALQVFQGNFRQGLLFLDMTNECDGFSEDLIAQLITLSFVNWELATLKVVAASQSTESFLNFLDSSLISTVTTFARSHLTEAMTKDVYKLDREIWFDSPQGQESLIRLNWLKRRKDRERAVQLTAAKPRRKVPFLFSLLTLGRARRS